MDSAGVRLTRVTLKRGAQTVAYGGASDVLVPSVLSQIENSLGLGSLVSRAEVLTPSGTNIRLLFGSGQATVVSPRAGTRLSELAFLAPRLLLDLDETEVDTLADLLGQSRS